MQILSFFVLSHLQVPINKRGPKKHCAILCPRQILRIFESIILSRNATFIRTPFLLIFLALSLSGNCIGVQRMESYGGSSKGEKQLIWETTQLPALYGLLRPFAKKTRVREMGNLVLDAPRFTACQLNYISFKYFIGILRHFKRYTTCNK